MTVTEPDAFEELLKVGGGGDSHHLDQVGFLDTKARMHELVGQLAVVGQEEQPFAGLIQTANGVDALVDLRDELNRPRPSGGVAVRAEVAPRFVDQPVNMTLRADRLTINTNALL